jgi:hypothetical protein
MARPTRVARGDEDANGGIRRERQLIADSSRKKTTTAALSAAENARATWTCGGP